MQEEEMPFNRPPPRSFMRKDIGYFMLVSALLVHTPIAAQAIEEIAAPEQSPALRDAPGADARERGLAALQRGNFVAAAAALQQAAGLGNPDAMRDLGDMSFAGKGVAQSYEQAIRWYCRSALLGNLEAIDLLVTIDLGGWSEIRAVQGWEAACNQWLRPPRPAQSDKNVTRAPEKSIEIRAEREPEYTPYVLWPGYSPWHLHSPGSRHLRARHPARKPARPRAPIYAPRLFEPFPSRGLVR
jgi:hypothetical protein